MPRNVHTSIQNQTIWAKRWNLKCATIHMGFVVLPICENLLMKMYI